MLQQYKDGISYVLKYLRLREWLSWLPFHSWLLWVLGVIITFCVVTNLVIGRRKDIADNAIIGMASQWVAAFMQMALFGSLLLIIRRLNISEMISWVMLLTGLFIILCLGKSYTVFRYFINLIGSVFAIATFT